MPSISEKHSNSLLLCLFNLLADFDGQISPAAIPILAELRTRSDALPPLYADVLGLPFSATCAELVDRIESLTQEQIAIASYAFQIFRSYEQLLKVKSGTMASEQKAAYESQLERVRLVIVRTRAALVEALHQNS
ncbi:hypothetical protein [Thermocoleostomius sinensis]|jgi:hypothetical protein|uniref:Uncharacterized protein n=1 Tax=Thermocoleostomius sinensis A174 TaxID=2016057 RepID=A0A9E8ZCI3_9CYAN|nr:hypothetical protein [Thermocoleostomius sinensis]WAL60744.1 hypothetical protein OXH18_01730 [Thermocoleostomius sinensis A174]